MNSEHFIEWFTQQLLPNISPTPVIVLDNASYHNKQKDKPPTTANRNDDIKRWLDEHNIEYDDKDIKKTFLEKVKQHRPARLYLTMYDHCHNFYNFFGYRSLNSVILLFVFILIHNIYIQFILPIYMIKLLQ